MLVLTISFRAASDNFGGDMIYYQGHCAPGIYARSFLEGRLTEEQLNNFRREVGVMVFLLIRIPT